METDLNRQWGFIEKYYPNYSTSSAITENEDLAKLMSGEQRKDDESTNLLERITDEVNFKFPSENEQGRQKQIKIEIYNRFCESSFFLFLESVQAFQEQQITE